MWIVELYVLDGMEVEMRAIEWMVMGTIVRVCRSTGDQLK